MLTYFKTIANKGDSKLYFQVLKVATDWTVTSTTNVNKKFRNKNISAFYLKANQEPNGLKEIWICSFDSIAERLT